MGSLSESFIFASVAGERLDTEHLKMILACEKQGSGSYMDCWEFRIDLPGSIGKRLESRLGITAQMWDRWRLEGAQLVVCVYAKNGKLQGGRMRKTVANREQFVRETEMDSQEMSIAIRVLDYLIRR